MFMDITIARADVYNMHASRCDDTVSDKKGIQDWINEVTKEYHAGMG